ncbi:MAG: FHA domain-containing protein [Planctomycetes bacterium]|nr:FHA domain-containing protein [Planctomycetota bacterium]
MPIQLLALTEGPSIFLDKPILLFGRDSECDVRFDSQKISRKHCCLAQVSNYLVIRDLGSTNGVRINGVRVLEGALKAGDELTIGNFKYQICWDAPGEPARTPIPGRQSLKSYPPAEEEKTEQPPEDEFLEEADSPVPLSDSDKRPVPVAREKPVFSPPADQGVKLVTEPLPNDPSALD